MCSSSDCQLVCQSDCVYQCQTSNFACYSTEALVTFVQDSVNRTSLLKGPQEEQDYGQILNFRFKYAIGTHFSCYYLSSGEVFASRTGQNPTGSMVMVSLFALIAASLIVLIIVLLLRQRTVSRDLSSELDESDFS